MPRKCYFDHNVPHWLAKPVRQAGFSVETSVEARNQRASDPDQARYAARNHMILITKNRKDFTAETLGGIRHEGIISYSDTLDKQGQEIMAQRIIQILTAHPHTRNLHFMANHDGYQVENLGGARTRYDYPPPDERPAVMNVLERLDREGSAARKNNQTSARQGRRPRFDGR